MSWNQPVVNRPPRDTRIVLDVVRHECQVVYERRGSHHQVHFPARTFRHPVARHERRRTSARSPIRMPCLPVRESANQVTSAQFWVPRKQTRTPRLIRVLPLCASSAPLSAPRDGTVLGVLWGVLAAFPLSSSMSRQRRDRARPPIWNRTPSKSESRPPLPPS